MPLPPALGKLNRIGLNRVTRHLATWLPGLGVVVHVGRRSGAVYRTPVNVFSADGRYIVALTYGADTDWLRNVLAAGGCDLITRGHRVRLRNPRIVHDETRAAIGRVARPLLGLLRVNDFVVMDTAAAR
jgi:deazaflavin-dependent oxidoreductase (nitroreductase family)